MCACAELAVYFLSRRHQKLPTNRFTSLHYAVHRSLQSVSNCGGEKVAVEL